MIGNSPIWDFRGQIPWKMVVLNIRQHIQLYPTNICHDVARSISNISTPNMLIALLNSVISSDWYLEVQQSRLPLGPPKKSLKKHFNLFVLWTKQKQTCRILSFEETTQNYKIPIYIYIYRIPPYTLLNIYLIPVNLGPVFMIPVFFENTEFHWDPKVSFPWRSRNARVDRWSRHPGTTGTVDSTKGYRLRFKRTKPSEIRV